jgi:hypothetical protein
VGAITVQCGYHLMARRYGSGGSVSGTVNTNFADYLSFYTEIFTYIKAQGLKIIAKPGLVFANSAFSSLIFDYTHMTLADYTAQCKVMIQDIANIGVDWIVTCTETDAATSLLLTVIPGATGADPTTFNDPSTGFNTPTGFANFVSATIPSPKNGAKVMASPPAWFTSTFVGNVLPLLTNISGYDGAAIHAYPWTSPDSLFDSTKVADIPARIKQIHSAMIAAGKTSIMDETYFNKQYGDDSGGVATTQYVFRRDNYSFWAPLDNRHRILQKNMMIRQGIAAISVYWANSTWFALLDYTPANSQYSYNTLLSILGPQARTNITAYGGHASGVAAGQTQYLSALGRLDQVTITTP